MQYFGVCRLSLGGPLIPSTKQPALYKIPVLPVGERVLLHLSCTIGACGAVSLQPFVALPVSMTGQLPLQPCWPCYCPCYCLCYFVYMRLPVL